MEQTLGNMIKTARKAAGLSQRQLAKLCGVSSVCICSIEHDHGASVALSTLVNLANHLNLDINVLQEKAGYQIPDDISSLANFIKKGRLEKSISQKKLGILCGTSHNYISLIEKGKITKPRLSTLVVLSEHLGLDFNTLLEISGYSTGDLNKDATLAELVFISRISAGLTQVQLSKHIGICRSRLSDIETGLYKKPKLATLKALSEQLNLDFAVLKKKAGYP